MNKLQKERRKHLDERRKRNKIETKHEPAKSRRHMRNRTQLRKMRRAALKELKNATANI